MPEPGIPRKSYLDASASLSRISGLHPGCAGFLLAAMRGVGRAATLLG